MNIRKFLLWIFEIFVLSAAIFCAKLPLLRKPHPIIRSIVLVTELFLVPVAALLCIAIVSPFAYRLCDWMMALAIALAGDGLACVIEHAVRRIRCKKKGADGRECLWKLNGILAFAMCFCITLYGVVNACQIKMNKHEWAAEGLTTAHTFAFVSDIHAGVTFNENKLKRLCKEINEENPEFVVLGGDITDENTTFEQMKATYSILSEINAPTYFIYGNHDRQPDAERVGGRTYTDEQLVETITEAGIIILSDEFAKIADDLVLLGREDVSMGDKRSDWSALENPYGSAGALVVADHQPYDDKQLAEEVSALQLSGHTHAGQMLPLQIIYRMLGLPAYGEFNKEGTRLFVSAGIGNWLLPFRTEEHCEWELVTLTPRS